MIETRLATKTIEEVIAPYVGATMARASTEAHCHKLGLKAEVMSAQEVQALLGQLERGLRVFVGPEKTGQMIRELEARLRVKGA